MLKPSLNPLHVGILCAMPEEIGYTLKNLRNIKETIFGDLKIFTGEWGDYELGDDYF